MKKNKIKYDKMWDYYQTVQKEYFLSSRERLNLIFKLIKKRNIKKVLEVGLGDGFLTGRFAKNKFNYTGLDFSKKNITDLSKKFKKAKNVELIEGNFNNIPLEDKSYDCILASEVIEHLSDKDLEKSFIESNRVLRKNGYFIVSVPDNENMGLSMTICPKCNEIFHKFGHQNTFTEMKLERMFHKYNFRDVFFTKYYDFPQDYPEFIRFIGKIVFKLFNLKGTSIIAIGRK